MVDSCFKLDFGRLERVSCGEGDEEGEGGALEGRVRGPLDLHLPPEEVVAHLDDGAAWWRIVQHCCQFLLDPLGCTITHFGLGDEICNTPLAFGEQEYALDI